jgi:hypothetical protein
MPSRKFIGKGPRLYGKFLTDEAHWAELSSESDLGEIYGGGYLPYSGDTDDPRDLFYMARSLRVKMPLFFVKKSRRYDHRRWKAFALRRELIPKEAFLDRFGDQVTELAYRWMEPRFGDASLARDRFTYILEKPFLRDVLTWWQGPELSAFALLVHGAWGAHYWYVFYKNGGDQEAAPGHGYLVDFLDWAKESSLPFAYLGTTYGGKSRYKSRGLDGIEFWDGESWNSDRDQLNQLRREDDQLSIQ